MLRDACGVDADHYLVDWNPAADQQALARVWRDGQKKECGYFAVHIVPNHLTAIEIRRLRLPIHIDWNN